MTHATHQHQHRREGAGPTRRAKPAPARDGHFGALVDRLGNRGLQALRGRMLQRKAEAAGVSVPEDPLELLADRVADQVVAEPAPAVGPAPPPVGEPASGTALQRDALPGARATHGDSMRGTPGPPAAARAPRPGGGPSPHGAMASELLSDLDAGAPMPRDVRRFMEGRFARTFADVRVHTDDRAAEAAASVAAKAFTIGSEIIFGAGRWAPETHEGKRLLAHELAHVVQQGADAGSPSPESAVEAEADRASHAISQGQVSDVSLRATPGTVQRDPDATLPRAPTSAVVRGESPTYETSVAAVLVEGQPVAMVTDGDASKTGQSWDEEWRTLTVYVEATHWAEVKTNPGARVAGVNRVVIDMNGKVVGIDMPPPAQPRPIPKVQPPKQRLPQGPPKPGPPGPAPPEQTTDQPRRGVPDTDVREPVTYRPLTEAETASERVAKLSDAELATMGEAERTQLLKALATSQEALDVGALRRLFDTTPESELTPLLDALFADRGRLLRDLTRATRHGDDQWQLVEALGELWGRNEKRVDDAGPRWRAGLFGQPVKLDREQYQIMLERAPALIGRKIGRFNEELGWQDQTRSWRTSTFGSAMGGFVDMWSGAVRPPTALEAMTDPGYLFLTNPYARTAYSSKLLARGDLFGAASALTQAEAENARLLSEWAKYQGISLVAGEEAIQDLEVVRDASIATVVVLGAGAAAPWLYGAYGGKAIGAGIGTKLLATGATTGTLFLGGGVGGGLLDVAAQDLSRPGGLSLAQAQDAFVLGFARHAPAAASPGFAHGASNILGLVPGASLTLPNYLRAAGVSAGSNFLGESLSATMQGKSGTGVLESGLWGAGAGLVSGPIELGISNRFANQPWLRVGAQSAFGGSSNATLTWLSGGSGEEIRQSFYIGLGQSLAGSLAEGRGPAFGWPPGMSRRTRSLLAATMLGTEEGLHLRLPSGSAPEVAPMARPSLVLGPDGRPIMIPAANAQAFPFTTDAPSVPARPWGEPEIVVSPVQPPLGTWAGAETPGLRLPSQSSLPVVRILPTQERRSGIKGIWEQTRTWNAADIADLYPAKVVPRQKVDLTTTTRGSGQSAVMGGPAQAQPGAPSRADWLHLMGLALGGSQTSPNLIAGATGPNYIMLPFELNFARMARGTHGAAPGRTVEVEVIGIVKPGTSHTGEGIIYRAWLDGELIFDTYLDLTVDVGPTEAEARFWRGRSTSVK